MVQTMPRRAERSQTRTAIVDCDIHPAPASNETLLNYLPARWHHRFKAYGARGYPGSFYPRNSPQAARADAWPPSGLPAGADLPFLRTQLLDEWEIEYGILNPLAVVHTPLDEYSAALATAVNDWQIAEWLEPEPRLRGAICVPYEDGEFAAAEIDRLGSDRRFVQVLLLARTREPLGKRRFWKIYEAATRHDLPVGIHFGGTGGSPFTGAGWPSFYLEDHGGMPQAFQAQLLSLVCEGVFERFPALKVVFIESGFAWLPSLIWRLDRCWEMLRDEVPHLQTRPSDSIRQHIWLTTQPMEEPSRPAYFTQLLDQLHMNDRLMFATDYPHWDFDAPDQAFPVRLPTGLKDRFLRENAHALYRLT
jgi:predicted TIM-barrel fold metal-dependent hydrolase